MIAVFVFVGSVVLVPDALVAISVFCLVIVVAPYILQAICAMVDVATTEKIDPQESLSPPDTLSIELQYFWKLASIGGFADRDIKILAEEYPEFEQWLPESERPRNRWQGGQRRLKPGMAPVVCPINPNQQQP